MVVREISALDTYQIRHLVLWPHIQLRKDCVIDIDLNKNAIHLGVFIDNQLVCIGSLFEMTNSKLSFKKQYRLRAMATHPDYRNRNAGKLLIESSISLLRTKGYNLLWCDAREVALGFYSKLGFELVDEWYNIKNVGRHKLLFYRL